MTVSTTDSRTAYTCNGATVAFSFPYLFLADADLVVLLVDTSASPNTETTLVLNTDYTVTGAGNPAGGTVTTTTAYSSGHKIVIYRDPALTQGLDLVDNDPLPAEPLEQSLDRSTLVAQRLADLQSRSMRLSDGDTSGAIPVLPTPAPLEHVRWDAAGKALESVKLANTGTIAVTPFTETLLDDADAAAFLSTLGVIDTGIDDGTKGFNLVYHPPKTGEVGVVNYQFQPGDVRRYGAVGDGVADDTLAIQNAIQSAINSRSISVGSINRNGHGVAFPAGTFRAAPSAFSSYADGDVRTLQISGAGMYSTTVVLTGDGALFDYTDPAKLLFTVISGIGFYGDEFSETDPNDATNPVSSLRKCMWSHSLTSSGVQGLRFYNCLFSRFGEVFVFESHDNESECKFYGCKMLKHGTAFIISNAQSLNTDLFATDIEQFVGSVLRVPLGDYSGDETRVGLGSLRIWGGSIIANPDASLQYMFDINDVATIAGNPGVLLNGVRFELRGVNNGLVRQTPDKHSNIVFNDCMVWSTQATADGSRKMAELGRWNTLTFNRTTFREEAGFESEYKIIGTAGISGNMGELIFNGCVTQPKSDSVIFDTAAGGFCGYAVSRNSQPSDPFIGTESQEADNWTRTVTAESKYKGRSKNNIGTHRANIVRNQLPVGGSYTSTIKLPAGAILKRVFVYAAPQGAATSPATYTLTDGNGATLYAQTITQQKDGLLIDINASSFVGGLAQALIGPTDLDRTLYFSSADAGQTIYGYGYVEYD